jgi:hypothetical protein
LIVETTVVPACRRDLRAYPGIFVVSLIIRVLVSVIG